MKERTKNNLLAAFAGESQARNKYTFFAKEARKAGLIEIAEFFEEAAVNEEQHAKLIYKLLHDDLKDTAGNLKKAIEGETYEYTDMYPEFEKMAIEDGDLAAASYFREVQKVEEAHSKKFAEYLEKLTNATLLETKEPTKWACRVCGYIHEGTTPPDVCPLCHHPKEYYKEIC